MKILFAHRGVSALAPENTLSAICLCKEHSIKWFEFDVAVLKDGTLICHHDDTLDRCTDRSGNLNDTTYAQLSDVDAGSWFGDAFVGERIPTLLEVIACMNDLPLNANIEIKAGILSEQESETFLQNLTDQIKEISPHVEIIVSSFNHILLKRFKELNPHVSVACLFTKENLWEDWKSIVQWCKAEYIHPESSGLTKAQVDDFRNAGLRVNVWTVNSLDRANELFNWGVHGVFTDMPHKFPSKYKTL